MDHPIQAERPSLVLVDKKERTCQQITELKYRKAKKKKKKKKIDK